MSLAQFNLVNFQGDIAHFFPKEALRSESINYKTQISCMQFWQVNQINLSKSFLSYLRRSRNQVYFVRYL